MQYYLASGEVGIEFIPKFREYGIAVRGEGKSVITIEFCPWCGSKLPQSLRTKWFERIDELGIDEATDRIPVELRSEEWYSKTATKGRRRRSIISNLPKKPKGGVPRRALKFAD